jgi:hypothetical protein
MPAGKAIATVAMPTAVFMGLGVTSSLALADNNSSSASPAKSLTAKEYKDCVTALDGSKNSASASPSPSASASGSDSAKDTKDSKSGSAKPAAPATPSTQKATSGSSGSSSSSDSGSGEKGTSKTSSSGSNGTSSGSGSGTSDTPTPTPSASASQDGGLLGTIGDALGSIFTGGSKTTPSPTPSASATPEATASKDTSSKSSGTSASDTVKDTTKKVTDTVKGTVKGVTGTASKAAQDATKTVKDTADAATASPSPSASSTTDPKDCPAATDAEGGIDNKTPLPDDPWYLQASSLTLKGADYQGIVKVRTANGTVKRVLKYVISGGTDIGDLHQLVKDKQSGKTYHVQAAKGSTSTITGGPTVMYTESISGNLLGLIPLTFTPDSPPPLNIPLIYFTNVKVTQAGQFGGTLTVPGMHQYTTD